MSSLATTLKQEISRLARKEVRQEGEGLKKSVSTYRSEIAELKRQVAALQKALKSVAREKPARLAAVREDAAQSGDASKLRFRAGGLAANRKRLGLSAADFGLLVGATGQSVYLWEQGKSRPNDKSLAAISALRGAGKRDVAARLAALKGKKK